MPATPTITAVNNQNGTATVTVTGSDGGSSNAIRYVRIGDPWTDAPSWATGGTRTGDGTVVITPPSSGVYWLTCLSTLAGSTAISDPIQRYINSGFLPPIEALLQQVQARIILLGLEDIDAANVYAQTSLDDWYSKKLTAPVVLIAPLTERHLPTAGPNNRDAVVYPIVVGPAAPLPSVSERHSEANRTLWFGWRYRIAAALTSKGFVLDDSDLKAVTSTVSPGPVVSSEWWARNAIVSPQVFNFEVWQPRGII